MHPFLFLFFFQKQRIRVQRYQVLQMELLILLAQQRLLVVRYDSRVTKVTSSGELPREPAWLITRGLAAHLVVMVRFTKLLQATNHAVVVFFRRSAEIEAVSWKTINIYKKNLNKEWYSGWFRWIYVAREKERKKEQVRVQEWESERANERMNCWASKLTFYCYYFSFG